MMTQGIKYAGSKLKLLPHIANIIEPLNVQTIFDGFSGTTRVGQYFKPTHQIVSNDTAIWSTIFAQCYLLNQKPKSYYQSYLDYLNTLEGIDDWFTTTYGQLHKQPFQIHNLKKLDAIRPAIDTLTDDPIEKSVLLTSLILALDQLDNTIGHFSSYLKEYSVRSYKTMQLKVPDFKVDQKYHEVYQKDIFDILPVNVDLSYYDPPYGTGNKKMPSSRVRYQAYYHIWATIIRNNQPATFGRVGRPEHTRDKFNQSPFEDIDDQLPNLQKLIQKTTSQYILLSYNNNGGINTDIFFDWLHTNYKVKIQTIDYRKNVMSTMRWTNNWSNDKVNKEYLILIEQ